MMRIKKKFLFLAASVLFFIFIYIYLNNNVPSNKNNMFYIEEKLKQLENGFKNHRKQFGEIKKQIDTLNNNGISSITPDTSPDLKKKILETEEVLPENKDSHGSCSLNMDITPKVDVQMLNAYREIPFDNIDGGAWKQGWNIEYDRHDWNFHHKLKVFVVPHSHNDPGWINTFDEYYERQTKHIFANMLRHLDEHPNMKFIWAETVFFAKWYDSLTSSKSKETLKRLVKNKQLEFVTGGWVMPDEACSHWYSVLQSLTEGQKWLKNTFNVTPVSSWAIDPFGHSSTSTYILKKSGFENLLIQRTHYSVKKYLAQHKQLEFKWSQVWDTKGDTSLFTHMMPFYSYDIPHTCGPDPKVCCQFDFKRLPGYGVTCPWKVPPQPITDENVAKKAEIIVDQWRKKSKLYKTRSVLIPLGDDFRYTQSLEWEAQRVNFEALFEHINNDHHLNVEAKFATLQEYFDSVKQENSHVQFPSLSGDFFTYSDRDDHYWSGYFTSRPYYKRMDRILMSYIRSAEILNSWHEFPEVAGLEKRLEQARRSLSIFQHHDGVSGTAKDYVMKDYDNMMVEGIKNCKFVMQQVVYRLLTEPSIYQPDYSYTYFNFDQSWSAGSESRPVIIIGEEVPFKYVVVHNSLPRERNELVEFYIAKPFVTVTDPEGNVITSQVSPVWSWHQSVYGTVQPQVSTTKYRLMFLVTIPPLGLSVYKINAKTNKDDSVGTSFAKVTIFADNQFNLAQLDEYPEKIEFSEHREISLKIDGESSGSSFSKFGLLKSLTQDSSTVPVHLEFLKYGTRSKHGEKSGAYLFLPDGPATKFQIGTPTVVVNKGDLQQDLTSGLPFVVHENILRKGESLEIRNYVDIQDMGNTEIVMRLSTNIENNLFFYTDLNGMQMMKRERFAKLPLQANYYPIPNGIFIEDNHWRMTLFSSQPLGGSSLKSGEIEIMQDRRLNQDDDLGLGQGVLDNRPTMNIFKVVLESRESCRQLNGDYPGGFLTPLSFEENKRLLHPIEKMIFAENEWSGQIHQFGENHEGVEPGIEIVSVRSLPSLHLKGKTAIGVVAHRTNFAECANDKISPEGFLNIKRLLELEEDTKVFNSHLTLLSPQEIVNEDSIAICPMDTKGFIISKS